MPSLKKLILSKSFFNISVLWKVIRVLQTQDRTLKSMFAQVKLDSPADSFKEILELGLTSKIEAVTV